jgi:hypothetical protein
MVSEFEAFESEIALIELFGRKDFGTGCLRNLTDGGDNPPAWPKGKARGTPAICQAISDATRMRMRLAATRRWIDQPHAHSEASKEKMRHPKSCETIQRMQDAQQARHREK